MKNSFSKAKRKLKRSAAMLAALAITVSSWQSNGLEVSAAENDDSYNISKVEYSIDGDDSMPIHSSHGYSVTNQVAAAYGMEMEIGITSTFKQGPFDILLVMDYSGSMSDGMDGGELVHNGISSWSNADYVAKHHEASRYRAMKNAVEVFLTKLEEVASEDTKVGIVVYNAGTTVRDFQKLSDTSTEQLLQWMENQTVGGATRADLALEKANQMLDALPEPEHEGQRNMVFFTDGEPGLTGFDMYDDGFGNFALPEVSAESYASNSFRVMAETMNQADILKGNYGTLVTTNNGVKAMAPEIENPWLEEPIAEEYVYYGASISPEKLGLGSNLEAIDDLRGSYETAASSGLLSELWKNSNNWDIYNILNADLSSFYGGDYSAANYASPQHGNYSRAGNGQGVKVHTVGLFDEDKYGSQKIGYVRNYLSKVSSDGSYFISADAEKLVEAFENIFEEIVGEFKGYVSFELGDDYIAYHADGRMITDDQSAGIWIDGTTLWTGPLDIISKDKVLDIVLISREQSLCEVDYIYIDGDEETPDILDSIMFWTEEGKEVNPGEEFAYVKSLSVAEKN